MPTSREPHEEATGIVQMREARDSSFDHDAGNGRRGVRVVVTWPCTGVSAQNDGNLDREQQRKSAPRGFELNLPVKPLARTGTLSSWCSDRFLTARGNGTVLNDLAAWSDLRLFGIVKAVKIRRQCSIRQNTWGSGVRTLNLNSSSVPLWLVKGSMANYLCP